MIQPAGSYNEALVMIREYYGYQRAKRSQVPLINHITEGLKILREEGASQHVKAAYCIHPLIQEDDDLLKNIRWCVGRLHPKVVYLAIQYREYANSYLCKPETDYYSTEAVHNLLKDCPRNVLIMLYADKIQNQKDFILYHHNSHGRFKQLKNYFENWVDVLHVLLHEDETSQ